MRSARRTHPEWPISKAVLDAKTQNHRNSQADPEAEARRDADRLAKKLAKLEADAASLGYKVVVLRKREKAAAESAA